MLIRYIGNKETKNDAGRNTGVAWNGKGDVQDVADHRIAKELVLKYPDIWEHVVDKETIDQKRIDDIKAAVVTLDPDSEEHMTQDGLPRIPIVTGVCGFKPTKAELEQACVELTEEAEAAEAESQKAEEEAAALKDEDDSAKLAAGEEVHG